eukprot:UN30291
MKPGVIQAFACGKVTESKSKKFSVGTLVGLNCPLVTKLKISEDSKTIMVWPLPSDLKEDEVSWGLSILGMPGATAYGGLIDVLKPEKDKKDQVIWVSSAAGAVGSIVGMLAKNVFNCTTVGSCGGPTKGEMIKKKFGYDHSIDYKKYKTRDELADAIKKVAP